MGDPVEWEYGPGVPTPHTRLRPGLRVEGRYELRTLLGRGAMGAVYRALDLELQREVALKFLLGEASEKQKARIRREGELTASLNHPGIVKVHAVGEFGGEPYLAYELIEGSRTLDEVLPSLELRERIELLAQAAEALGQAHALGIVHRDVKPQNLLVSDEPRVKVADFGLARGEGNQRLTKSGALVGTPLYMSPEAITGSTREIGPPSDVWALGVILYEALTGALPFEATDSAAYAVQVVQGVFTPPRDRVPDQPELDAICRRALEVETSRRYPDGGALASDLRAWLEGRVPEACRRRRPGWLALGLLGLIVLGVVALLLVSLPRSAGQAPAQAELELSDLIELAVPLAAETWDERVALTGRANEGPDWVLVRLDSQPARQVAAGAEFELQAPLSPGVNQLRLTVETRAGERAQLVLSRTRLVGPPWFERLSGVKRPPVPLPAGLEFGELPGEYLNRRDGSVLVYVPPGRFRMGAGLEPWGGKDQPHLVELTRGYYLGKYEVTQAQFADFLRATGRRTRPIEGETFPVRGLTWNEAAEYCRWAGLRLPSEAEWEYAARGEDGREFPWGNEAPDQSRCNYEGEDTNTRPTPVGSFPTGVSPFGCHDMAGNVSEWVADWFEPYPAELVVDPVGPDSGTLKVYRGGGLTDDRFYQLRSERRAASPPLQRGAGRGFRVAR